MHRRQFRLLLDSLLLGVIGALSARAFDWALALAQSLFLVKIAGYTPPALPDEGGTLQQSIGPWGLWLLPLSTTLGGLLSGLLVFSFAPEAEGHGTDTAIKAFHMDAGRIRWRVPPLKMIASAITIGSGGSAGREGPTALITAGVGSAYGTLSRRSEEDRRTLVLVGMAAGISAMFRSPIGAAIFAIEVLYSDIEFEVGALVYAMFASIVAYALNGLFVSWQPLFYVPETIQFSHRIDYLGFVALGLLGGVVATLLPPAFYGMRDLFLRLPIPVALKPALGGLLLGLLAVAFPQALGGGYGWIQQAINGSLTVWLLLALVFVKLAAVSFSVSSGGSGGVFAPSLFIGAMLGGALAEMFHEPAAPFVVVGMASVFGGAARVPIATLLMVTEMTGGFHLLVHAALSVLLSYLVQSFLSEKLKYKSLYESQVAGRPDSPAHIVEHVKIATKLIQKRKLPYLAAMGDIDAEALLSSGVPVTFPDGEQLAIGIVAENSPWKDRVLSSHDLVLESGDRMEIISVLRGKEILAPHPSLKLDAGDRIIALASVRAWAAFREALLPRPPAKA